VHLDAGCAWELPAARHDDTIRTAYVFGDGVLDVDGHGSGLSTGTGAVLSADGPVRVSSAAGTEVLVLQGRPIGEPVAQHGPFVMNDSAGIEQAFADYRRTGFGGWPWPSDEPVHHDLAGDGRFARRPGGVVERP
jgi:redox-sensitive bicupin YhaK (pirin superfamily)